MIQYSDFEKIDIRVGTIVGVEDFPEARKPAYKLTIDFGEDVGVRRSSAQITDRYSRDALLNTKVLAVVNFEPKQIGPFKSEVLVLGTSDQSGAVILADPGVDSVPGSRLF